MTKLVALLALLGTVASTPLLRTNGGTNPPGRKCTIVASVPQRVQVLRCVDGIKVYVWSHRYHGWIVVR